MRVHRFYDDGAVAMAAVALRQREGDQPLPVTTALNQDVCVQDAVMADIEERKLVGISRYGTVLRPFNGRDTTLDAYQEAMDLTMYLKQLLLEKEGREDQASVVRWSEETFGVSTWQRAGWRSWEEMKEFQDAMTNACDHPSRPGSARLLAGEAADVVITLFTWAERAGLDLISSDNRSPHRPAPTCAPG